MEIKVIPIKSLQRLKEKEKGMYKLGDDITIGAEPLKEMCSYYQLPGTLVQVDEALGTNFVQQAMLAKTGAENPMFIVEDGKAINPLDPRSEFVSDDRFEEFAQTFEAKGFHVETTLNNKGIIRKKIELSDKEENLTFVNDIYSKQLIIERLPEGGIHIGGQVTRLACTNGQRVVEKELSVKERKGAPSDAKIQSILASMLTFKLSDYYDKIWSVNGHMIPCSVGDYLGMRSTLESMVGPFEVDKYFPLEPITSHYLPQNVDISTIDRNTLKTIPAGVSYYSAFNFLTNGVKVAENRRVQDEIAVARWAAPSTIRKLRQVSSIQYQGEPTFPDTLVRQLQGDAA